MNAKPIYTLFLLSLLCCRKEPANTEIISQHEYTLDAKASKFEQDSIPIISFVDSTTYNFGTITFGDTVTHHFQFKNTGKLPLKIHDVSVSCGCTIVDFPKQALQAGEVAKITARFLSWNGDRGIQNKVISVYSNSINSVDILTMIGTVK